MWNKLDCIINASLHGKLTGLSRKLNTDVPEILFATLQALLHRYKGTADEMTFSTLLQAAPSHEVQFEMSESYQGLSVQSRFSTDNFITSCTENMEQHYLQLLQSITENPDAPIGSLKMITPQEEDEILRVFNKDAHTPYPAHKTIVDLFEEQVSRTPEHIALTCGDAHITYRELNERSNQLGNYLRSLGVQEEQPVPVCLEKSIDMIVSLLAILKAGAAYVPVDPAYPEDRLRFTVSDCGASIMITTAQHAPDVDIPLVRIDVDAAKISEHSTDKVKNNLQPHNLSYIIYTSGTTGKPKGVLTEHRNVVRLFEADGPVFDFTDRDVWTMFHSYCFDFSVWEMYGALFYGGRLVIVTREVARDPAAFTELLISQNVTILSQTPSALYALQEYMVPRHENISLRYVFVGGEAVNYPKLKPWSQRYLCCKLVTVYGITETTVFITTQNIEAAHLESSASIIGKPLPNYAVYILDNYHNLVPVGFRGEIFVGGSGVARGYLNRPELTAARFVKDKFEPDSHELMYKSGDVCRWLPDGTIEYFGRNDSQVKIRGHRIELGEIETALSQLPQVNNACVIVKEGEQSEGKKLVAFYVADRDAVLEEENQLYEAQVRSWQQLYDMEFATGDEAMEEEFNISGWNDSFTKGPVDANNMRQWLDDIMQVIRSGKIENVLEIGCGTGLIYYQLAEHIRKYTGIDFSRECVNKIRRRIAKKERNYPDTRLQVCEAHQLQLAPNEPIDTIIINSVVQYFPGERYLTEIIEKAVSLLNTGRIIIGDVRDLRLLKWFKARLLLKESGNENNRSQFMWQVEQAVLRQRLSVPAVYPHPGHAVRL